jgi:hypothetical protein
MAVMPHKDVDRALQAALSLETSLSGLNFPGTLIMSATEIAVFEQKPS